MRSQIWDEVSDLKLKIIKPLSSSKNLSNRIFVTCNFFFFTFGYIDCDGHIFCWVIEKLVIMRCAFGARLAYSRLLLIIIGINNELIRQNKGQSVVVRTDNYVKNSEFCLGLYLERIHRNGFSTLLKQDMFCFICSWSISSTYITKIIIKIRDFARFVQLKPNQKAWNILQKEEFENSVSSNKNSHSCYFIREKIVILVL